MNASKNISASVKARLQNVAAKRGDDFSRLLLRDGIERPPYRFGLRQERAGQLKLIIGSRRRLCLEDRISVLSGAPVTA